MGALPNHSSYDVNVHIDNEAQKHNLPAPERRDAIEVKKVGTDIVVDMLLFNVDGNKGGEDEMFVEYAATLQLLEDCSVELRDQAQTALIDVISELVKQLTLPEAEKTNIKNMLKSQGMTKLNQILGTDVPQITNN